MSYFPPKKNAEYIFYISLASQSDANAFQSNPTLAAGDAKVSIDGGTLNNLGTLPAVTPASSKLVKVTLSADEMNGDNIAVIFSDAAGAEWKDLTVSIHTVVAQIDDIYTRIGAPVAASISADIAGVQSDTNDIQSRLPAALTADGNIKADALKLNGATPNNLTSAQTASAVLDATASSYNTSGTIGAKINSAANATTLGSGAIQHTVTVQDTSSNPIDGAEVWITTDSAGSSVVASGQTNASGQVTFMLDAGTYYQWVQVSGHNFSNPTTVTVS